MGKRSWPNMCSPDRSPALMNQIPSKPISQRVIAAFPNCRYYQRLAFGYIIPDEYNRDIDD